MQNLSRRADKVLFSCFGVWLFALFTLIAAPKEWVAVCGVAGGIVILLFLVFVVWSVYMFLKSL